METFGPRVIGLQISRHGDGMTFERRPVRHGAMPVYTHRPEPICSSIFAPNCIWSGAHCAIRPTAVAPLSSWCDWKPRCGRAERSTLARRGSTMISASRCAMLVWAARHPHLEHWVRNLASRMPAARQGRRNWSNADLSS